MNVLSGLMKGHDTRVTTEFGDCISIVANNDIVNHMCKTKAAEYARQKDQPLIWVRAHDIVHSTSDLDEEVLRSKFLNWWQLTHNKCGYLFGALPIAMGMPVQIVADHPAREKHILKGTIGHICGWDIDEELDPTQSNIFLKKMPSTIYVQFYEFVNEHKRSRQESEQRRPPTWKINDLPPGVYPIKPIKRWWQEHGGNTVTRLQFPLSPAYARSAYSMQGKTVERAIVDLLLRKGTDPATGYVTFSRFRDAAACLILQPFDVETFQQGEPLEPGLLVEFIRTRIAGRDTSELMARAVDTKMMKKRAAERREANA